MRHNTHNITARCLYGLGMLTAACSVNSDAQETAAREALGPKAEPVIEEIVVTGSRLARTELTSTSPITVLGDEEIDSWGVSRIEGFIRATNINTGRLAATGFDVNAAYGFEFGRLGALRLRYIATRLNEFEEQSLPGATTFDCAGFYGGACGTPRPEYRHRLSLDWRSRHKLSATFAWRLLGRVDQFSARPSPVSAKLKATSFFDLSLNYALMDKLDLRLGINNLLDQTPPLTSIAGFGGTETSGRGNTFPQIYDAQGRFVFGLIQASF